MSKLRPLLLSATATLALTGGAMSAADDTEIFFTRPAENGSRAANVLFMFDTSGSMNGRDGGTLKRITRLKQAMLQVLDGTAGVNIGIGAFNGSGKGGAILYPTTDPDGDVCPDSTCDSIDLTIRVRDTGDDAEQRADGTMLLNETMLDLGRPLDPASIVSQTFTLENGENDVTHRSDGALITDSTGLSMFYESGDADPASLGLRFPDIGIPASATVLQAQLHFSLHKNGSAGNPRASIRLDASPDSPPFASAPGLRVADRPSGGEVVAWHDIPWESQEDRILTTPDLASLFNERLTAGDWSAGDPVTLLFTLAPDTWHSPSNYRLFKSWESDPARAPRLEVVWTESAQSPQTVGMRFADLDVPRGAQITAATVEFAAAESNGAPASIEISAEDSGHSAPFSSANGDISSRTRASQRTTWQPEPWITDPGDTTRYRPDPIVRTGDLTTLVQQITDRSDWCGGNALSLLFEGSGLRRAFSRDDGRWTAPKLKVSYDPSTIDYATTCLSRSTQATIARASDDAAQHLTSNWVDLNDMVLATVGATEPAIVGLRFTDIDVPQNATISNATLTLNSAGAAPGTGAMTVRGELRGYSAPFQSGAGQNISTRPETVAEVAWDAVEASTAGNRVSSPDLSAIVREIVERPNWTRGSALALKLRDASATGRRPFTSFESDPGAAAALTIDYQLDGAAIGGAPVTLRTARDEMRDLVLEFEAHGGTPLVDAYYEAASYLHGREVDFGRTRGHAWPVDRFKRLSTPASWSGGTVYSPPGCDEVDPNAIACVDERIDGSPVYDAPIAGACQVNQIVLLSDGATTYNNSVDRITNLTGEAACEARANATEECGLELGNWLNGLNGGAGDGLPRVKTHTVGFNFSSPFLEELAALGGGRFETADSATELAGVFKSIVTDAADLNTSFVAPAASVSRFNRLTNSDDVYYAMFKPDVGIRWDGNLKRYELNADPKTGETTIVDRNGKPIFDEIAGGIRSDAESWWPDSLPGADGPTVAAGGAANQLPATRDVRTFLHDPITEQPGALIALHEDTISLGATALGIGGADGAYRTELLRWARGVDVRDVDGDGDTAEVRQQMGDPMHSTPLILHYDVGATELSRVFVGTNEGYLHAIDTASGAEDWAIVPDDLLPNLPRFLENESGATRPYGLDGPIMGWMDDTDGNGVVDAGDSAYVLVGMRRGGRNYYAFDVSDPSDPRVAWTIRGGSGDFAELGESWSMPVKTRMLVGSTPTEVLVFAGGYDPDNDTREQRNAYDAMGRAIFIVDAATGSLIETLENTSFLAMDYAIPSDLNVIDIDLDGMADLMFVGDMGGQLWRFDIDNSGSGTTSVAGLSIEGGVIAELNGGAASGNRRFYEAPDVALIELEDRSTVLNVSIGSGWRAHPLDTVVDDRFYAIRQTDVFGPPRNADGDISYTTLTDASLFNATTSRGSTTTSTSIGNGWFLDMEAPGEKVLARSLTLDGTIMFTTYLPDAEAVDECSVSVGAGRLYKVDARYGDPVQNLSDDEDAAEESGELTLEDRSRLLKVPGIPAAPQVYVGDANPDAPIVATGDGTEDSGLGSGRERTYWVEN